MNISKYIIVLLFILINYVTFASVRTLNNNNPSPGQYTTWNAVQLVSNPGDTIYVSGSNNTYGNITVTVNNLKIIGAGYSPSKQNPLPTTFVDITYEVSNVSIEGIQARYLIQDYAASPALLDLRNCALSIKIKNTVYNPYLNIRYCILGSDNFPFAVDIQLDAPSTTEINGSIIHCKIINTINLNSGTFSGFSFSKNLFISSYNSTAIYGDFMNSNFTFNILYKYSDFNVGLNPTVVSYNCIYSPSYPNFNSIQNDGGTTLVADPLFVSPCIQTPFCLQPWFGDYRLQANSPCKNVGPNDEDIGMFDESVPFFEIGGEPFNIPQIKQFSVPTSAIYGTTITGSVVSLVKSFSSSIPTLTHVEYFWNTDPGFGNGTIFTISSASDSVFFNIPIQTTNLSLQSNYLYIRTQNSNGQWSLAEGREIDIQQGILAAEYYIDVDPGQGNGTAIPIPLDYTVNFSGNIQLPVLTTGLHKLAIRTLDTEGYWSHPEYRSFYISPPNNNTTNIVAAEFFVDTEPGLGSGLPISITTGSSTNFNGAITLPTISTGMHTLNIRTKDNLGKWSHVEQRNFFGNPESHDANAIVAMEYYIDNEPGLGSGIPLSIIPNISPNFIGAITLPTIATGLHTMNLRAKDNLGKWSHVEQRIFYADPATHDATSIVAAEYFVDTDPGLGSGLPISIIAGTNSNFSGSILLPTTTTGMHTLNIRTKDNLGKWCISERCTFFAKPFADASQIVAAEYYIDNDPGFENAINIPISSPAATINYCGSISLPTLTSGTHKLFVRTKDNTNIWSHQEPRTLTGIGNSNVSITPDSTVTICFPGSLMLTASTTGGFNTYQWYKNCELIVGATSATYNATDTGNFYVIVSNGTQTQSASVQVISGTCNSILQVTCLIEGYWDGLGGMQAVLLNQGEITTALVCDSIDIELHDENTPYGLLFSSKTLLYQNGIAAGIFPPLNAHYYIVIKHRNGIETWSANPVLISANTDYNFTTAANKAYGSNQTEVEPGVWAIYSGDINQDGSIDALDYLDLDVDIVAGNSGYLTTDLNGDGSVDALDYLVLDPNIISGVGAVSP